MAREIFTINDKIDFMSYVIWVDDRNPVVYNRSGNSTTEQSA